jgi:cysteinyl-tRNA synthetase
MDTLIRTLKIAGLEPNWVMNITDVGHLVSDADEGEDKLEKGARREGKTAWEVAEFYTHDFLRGMELLSITTPTHIVKATDHIEQQIALIKRLEEKGFTYVIDDGVYYDTSKFEGYASFAQLDLDEQREGARVAINQQKRNQSDFALWKFSPKDHKRDMEWDSPWGEGFPGWHIECSAMSMEYLGETLDIHTGGIDHIPVHHTNEIAQSEGATGKRFANVWMHSNHVMINGEKISKSLGNGIKIQDVLSQGFSTDDLRLSILISHYRTQSKFSWDSLRDAHFSLKYLQDNIGWVLRSGVVREESLGELRADLAQVKREMIEALFDDLNTPKALSILHEFGNRFATVPASQLDIPTIEDFAKFVQEVLGIDILDKKRFDFEEPLKIIVEQRNQARTQGDWELADRLRVELEKKGLTLLKDMPEGSIWYREYSDEELGIDR